MAEVTTIRSSRLDLVSISEAFIDALVEGRRDDAAALIGAALPPDWPDRHDEGFLVYRARQMREEPERQPWLVRALILRETGTMVGHAGFHGPPGVSCRDDPDAVELGYSVFAAHRGRGLATEAVEALLQWSQGHGIRRFVLSIGPENEHSLAIARKLGFVQDGEHWDEEDGRELEFVLES